jgi:flagellar protein FliS
MSTDPARSRYLADAVATATPAKRIVLLYDRLWLDIQRGKAAQESSAPLDGRDPLLHAQQIVAELLGSLNTEAWPGAHDLASLYSYLLRELIEAVVSPHLGRLEAAGKIVCDLRSSWQEAEVQLQTQAIAGASAETRKVA